MTEGTVVAGTHEFVVPDPQRARVLAETLSGHGFFLVIAKPDQTGLWRVIAYDDGPYPAGIVGARTIDAVGRQAAVLARQQGGYLAGGIRCDPNSLDANWLDATVWLTNPGARPPVPTIVMTPPPPDVPLALTPDTVRPGTASLTGLRDIDWARLGRSPWDRAEYVPDAIEALTVAGPDWDDRLDELLTDDLLHQGSCQPATAPALTFLIRLAASGTLPSRCRYLLCERLVFAAHQRYSRFLSDPDRDAFLGRTPQIPVHVQQVHDTIGENLPTLLARWNDEPPAVRYLLAALAGMFPEPGRQITGEVIAMACEYPNTQRAAYLDLAAALLHADDDVTMRICREIFAWNGDIPLDWLEAPGVPPAFRAGRILADGILFTTTSTRR
jgi:hypothetical protein